MFQPWNRTPMAAGAIALLLFAAACGKSASGGGAYGAAGGGSSPVAAGSGGGGGGYGGRGNGGNDGYGGGGGGGGGSQSGGGASVLTVTQDNFAFSPAEITVKSGDTITVTDANASTPHTFTIKGSNIDITNDPSKSQTVTIDLQPGTYEFYCRFHVGSGMKGSITVT